MNAIIERFANTRCWTNYKIVERDGRTTKPPCSGAGIAFNSFDNNNVLTFDHATSNVSTNAKISGVGIAFVFDGLLVGVDLDDIITDGVITDETAKRFISEANSYTEVTPSGEGLHVLLWVHGVDKLEKISPNRHGKFEVYNAERYFTFTGKVIDGYNHLREVSVNELIELLKIIGWPWGKEGSIKPTTTIGNEDFDFYDVGDIEDVVLPTVATSQGWVESDDDILQMMSKSSIGGDFVKAYSGNLRTNASDNDFALIKHLAWATRHDRERVRCMFLASPAAQRDKAQNRGDYFDRTYDAAVKALAGKMRDIKRSVAQPAQTMPEEGKTSQDGGAAIVVTRESEIDELLLNAHLNAAGNGDCFAEKYKNHAIYEVTSKKWLVFNGERWKDDESLQCNRYAREIAQMRYGAGVKIADLDRRKKFAAFCISSETPAAVEQMLKAASSVAGMQKNIKDFDTNKYLACAGDYTLDLENNVAYGSKYDDYLTLKLGAKFDKDAKCPRWVQFINEIFDNNAELIAYVKRALGYCITGSTSENKIFLLHGDGANGKSLFLQVVTYVMGDFATSMPFTVFDANERTNVQQELFNAKGKRFISVIETNQDRRLDEALIKNLTGKDEVTGRRLFCEPVKFYPQFKIWLAMNHKPHIVGRDHGIWRRISLIPFNQNFTGKEEKRLEEKLLSEASGILNWILEGLIEYKQIGLNEPKIILDAVKQYRNEEDILQQWLTDCANLTSLGKVQSSKAFQSFIAWAQSVNIKTSISMMKFSLMMAKAGFETATYTGRKFFQGIELVEP